MTYHSVEGTWDEVMAHANEFIGHRVRVTVIDDKKNTSKSLAEMLKGKTGTVSLNAPSPASKIGKTFTDLL